MLLNQDVLVRMIKSLLRTKLTDCFSEGMIETSVAFWWTQVVVVKFPTLRHKKKMCIAYSQTVNYYSELDEYPLL